MVWWFDLGSNLDIDGSIRPLAPPDGREWWSPPTDDWSSWVYPRAFNETPFPVALLDDLVELNWATGLAFLIRAGGDAC